MKAIQAMVPTKAVSQVFRVVPVTSMDILHHWQVRYLVEFYGVRYEHCLGPLPVLQHGSVYRDSNYKQDGFSVRCLRD